ncbi:MAG: sigma-70 family RNA polymerase sigma factor [Bacteroidota bacterium]
MPANNSHYCTYTDQELVALLRLSDHSAYTEIYRRYHQLMLVFALKKLENEDLAADFVQDLFTSVWLKRDTILESGNLAAYLYISLRSRILDYFSHQKVRSKYLDALAWEMELSVETQTDYLARERSMQAYIDLQIGRLPSKMRRAFELSRKELLSHKEIAELLHTTEDNVSKHITGALRALRSKLNSWFF